jgi:hypothetical protein
VNNQRVILTMVLTSILSGYIGWLYAKKVDPLSGGAIQIHGLSSLEGAASLFWSIPEQHSPTTAVTKCKITKFQIDSGTEGMEQALVRLGDITPSQFRCLLDEVQTYVEGEPPPSPLSHGTPKPSYRPLYMTFEPVNQNAQRH